MDILNKSIRDFSFDEVVTFCQQGIPEGTQVDYKEDYPDKGFAKHLAAFSNTRGGVIILGVKENKTSGLPETCVGVLDVAKKIERFHQEATNVEPIPVYDICATDEKNGKAFILIRIYEGNKPPYFVQNVSNVWIRNGSVSNPIDLASPDGLELLIGKREMAEKARMLCLQRAEEVYKAGIDREEKKRKLAYEKGKLDGQEQSVVKFAIGSNTSLCTIALQPYFPKDAIAEPRIIKEKLRDITFRLGRAEYPVYSHQFETIPEGILSFSSRLSDGFVESHEFFGQGLIFNRHDVLIVQDDKSLISLYRIAHRIFLVLQFTKNFYNQFGYQGVVKGLIALENVKDIYFVQIMPSGWNGYHDDTRGLLSKYDWEIDLDTRILNDPILLKEHYLKIIRDIYWSLGYENLQENLMEAFFRENGFIF